MRLTLPFLILLLGFSNYSHSDELKFSDIVEFGKDVFSWYEYIETTATDLIESDLYQDSQFKKDLEWELIHKPRIQRQVSNSIRTYFESCPGCPEILPLADGVNEVIQTLARDIDEENPNAHLAEQVEGLEVILMIVNDLNQCQLNNGQCISNEYLGNNQYRPIIESSTVLVFEGPIDTEHLQGITIRTGEAREYWYRAKITGYIDEVIIHLIIDEHGQSYIEYYSGPVHQGAQVVTTDPGRRIRPPGSPPDPPAKPDDVYGLWYGFYLGNEATRESGESTNYLSGNIALAIDMPRGGVFPERVLGLNIDAVVQDTSANLNLSSQGLGLTMISRLSPADQLNTGITTDFSNIVGTIGMPRFFTLKATTNYNFDALTVGLNVPTEIHLGRFHLSGSSGVSHTAGTSEVGINTNYVVTHEAVPRVTLTAKTEGAIIYEQATNDADFLFSMVDIDSEFRIDENSTVTLTFDYTPDKPVIGLSYTFSK